MTTQAGAIKHLWTHKTQDHPWLSDEQLVIDRAEGVWVWTEDGKKLMDGFAGLAVVNVGHGRREIAEAIAEQTVKLAYYPTTRQFSNRPAAELAAKLATLTPGDLDYTMFATSGSEANERAMQIARHYWIAQGKPGKHKVISLHGGYHGATMGTFAVCGLPHMTAAYAALQPAGFTKVAPPYPFRDRGTGTDAQLVQRRAAELRDAIVKEGVDTVSAVIMEPILSSGGFIIPPLGWLRAVRADLRRARRADDRRRGHHGLRAHRQVVRGRPRGRRPRPHDRGQGHHLRLPAAVGAPSRAGAWPTRFGEESKQENVHPNTYAAHPVACAAGLANLQIMEKDRLVENAAAMGARLLDGLQQAIGGKRIVGEVRGRGLLVCAELVAPDGSGKPLDAAEVAKLDRKAWERGTIVYARGQVLRLAPPLCITPAEVDRLVEAVAGSISELDAELTR